MKRILFVSAASAIILLFSCPVIFAFGGPLQVKDQFPLFIHLDEPYMESARTETFFSAGLSHSSVYMVRNSSDWSVDLDMEITELNLRYRRVLPVGIEVGMDIPLLLFGSGFMDDFLNGYHNFFGFPDYGRGDRPSDQFTYELRRKGELVVKGEEGRIGLGDIRLTVKKELLRGDPVISVRADMELPTGDSKSGFGSGGLDTGFALLMDKDLGRKFRSYTNIGIVFPGSFRGSENVHLRTAPFAATGVEAALWERVSLLGQVFFGKSPFPKTGIGSIDRIAVLLSLGARYSAGRDSLEFSLTEDPNTAGAPDVTFNLTYKRRF